MKVRLVMRGGLSVIATVALAACISAPALGAHRAAPSWPYKVYRPASLSKSVRIPLVVLPTGNIQHSETTTNLDAAADRFGFEVVYAQIVKSYDDVARAQGESSGSPYPDMTDLANVIDTVTAADNIDPNRVFMTGESLGGTMSYRAACILADRLTAVAPIEAVVVLPNCRPSRPVSVFAINGTADAAAPYEGGSGFMSVRSAVDLWKTYDGCASPSTSKTTSGAVTTETWTTCSSGAVVQLATIQGGGHVWPGEPGLSPSSPDGQLDAASAVSGFFLSLPHTAQLSAKVVSVMVKRSKGKVRTIVIRTSVNAGGALTATLRLKNRSVYHVRRKLVPGAMVLSLALPARLAAGTYLLQLDFSTALGSKSMRRTVHVPSH